VSRLLSFSLAFPDVPPVTLLQELLQAEFQNYFRPKIGQIGTSDESLEVGAHSLKQLLRTTALISGERLAASNFTDLPQYPDPSLRITAFLAKLSRPLRFGATFLGDYGLDYCIGADTRHQWIFRYGDDTWRQAVVRFAISDYGPISSSHCGCSVLFTVPCPWFFLGDWWHAEDPPFSTPQTVQRNWKRLIEFVYLPIDIVGEEQLEQTLLSVEGRSQHQTSEWLIEQAQRLPKLRLYLA
jgi:hypothetical protein